MDREIPQEVLLRLLRQNRPRMQGAAHLNRRHFLTVSAASGTLSPLLAAAATTLPPKIDVEGRVLRVAFAGRTWLIDAARFGDSAQVSWRTAKSALQVFLTRAHYPGTTVPGDLRADIYNDGAQWRIAIEFGGAKSDALLAESEAPLLDAWMAGTASFTFRHAGRFQVGEVSIHSRTSHFAFTLDAGLRLSWQGPTRIDLLVGQLSAGGGSLVASAGSHELLQQVLDRAQPRAVTSISLEQLASSGTSFAISRVGASHRVEWDVATPLLTMIAFDTTASRHEALAVLEAAGSLGIKGPGLPDPGSLLLLKSAVLTTWASSPRRRVQFAFSVQRSRFLVEAGGFALQVSGAVEPVAISIEKGFMASWVLDVELHEAHLPVRGASMASVSFEPKPLQLSLVLGGSVPPRSCIAYASLAARPVLDLPLESGKLHLKRSADLFDLRFEFRNYRIECAGGRTYLFVRWAHEAGCEARPNPPTLIAVFWPQHVQEEVFSRAGTGFKKPRPIDTLKFPNELARTALSGPSRVAMQGLHPALERKQGVELTIEQITDWKDLSLAVNSRALPADASLTDQLKANKLESWTLRSDARNAIFTNLTTQPKPDQTALEPVTGLIVSPDKSAWFETPRSAPIGHGAATLWTARLRLGQNSAVRALHARRANFGFLSGGCGPGQPELHTFPSTLSAQDRAELVVLMSAYVMPSLRRLQRDKDDDKGAGFFDDPKGMVLRPTEKLAFLSDAVREYTVPSIGGGPPTTQKVLQEGVLLPRGFQEFELSMSALKGTLRSRWEGEPPAPLSTDPFFASALNIEGYIHRTAYGRDALVQVAYKGFLFPLGHRAALIKVSERPFSPARGNTDLLDPTAYLIQRNYIVCRRPSKVFPAMGQPFKGREFPASSVEMVTVVTPEIVPVDLSPDERLDLSTLMFGATQGDCLQHGREAATSLGRVFWPRTRPGVSDEGSPPNRYGYEVQFEYKVDGNPQPMRSALIFVDNTAAHHAPTMQAVVQYYETLEYWSKQLEGERAMPATPATGEEAKKYLRIAVTGGVERKYAPALKSGETRFQTEYWVLGATGGVGTDAGSDSQPPTLMQRLGGAKYEASSTTESFSMDALMEGADQPPFYPRMHRGYIKMQPLDRLLGRPQGLIEVGFANRYVVHAMEPAANPAAIYLDVLAPIVDLDVSGQGDASGGVAKPNARLAAISRSQGMIGGRSVPQPDSQTKAAPGRQLVRQGMPAGVPAAELKYDTSSAQAGKFDAAEFLGGAVADALLLGVIPLKDVIRVVSIGLAPKLREVSEYASAELASALPDIAHAIDSAIVAAVQAGNDAVHSALGNSVGANPLQEFYPALASRSDHLQQVCKRIAQLPTDDLKLSFPALAGDLLEAGKDFVQAIEQVAANPAPQGLAEYLKMVREAEDALRSLADPVALRRFVTSQVHAIAASLFDDLTRHLFGSTSEIGPFDIAFGIATDASSGTAPDKDAVPGLQARRAAVLQELVGNPTAAVDRLRHSAMQQSLPGFFAQAFSRLDAMRREVTGLLMWARAELADVVLGLLAQGDAQLRRVLPLQELAMHFAADVAKELDGFDAATVLLKDGVDALLRQVMDRLRGAIEKTADQYRTKVHAEAKDAADAFLSALDKDIQDLTSKIEAAVQPVRDELEARLRAAQSERGQWKRALELKEAPTLAKSLERAVRNEMERQVHALEAKARAAAEDMLGRVATEIASAVGATLEAGSNLIEMVARSASSELQNWCSSGAAGALRELQAVVLGTKVLISETLKAASALNEDLVAMVVPLDIPAEQRAEAESLLAQARRLIDQAIEQGEKLRDALEKAPQNPCTAPTEAAKVIGQFDDLVRARLRLLDNLVSGLGAAARFQVFVQAGKANALKLSAKPATADLCARIKDTIDKVRPIIVAPQQATDALKARAGDVDKLVGPTRQGALVALMRQLSDKAAVVANALQELAAKCDGTSAALDKVARDLESQRCAVMALVEGEERRLAGFLLDMVLPKFVPTAALTALGDAMSKASPFVAAIGKLHSDLQAAVDGLLQQIGNAASGSTLSELLATLARPGLAALAMARDAVGDDAKLIANVTSAFKAKDSQAALVAVNTLQVSWQTRGVGIVRAAELLSRVVQSLMHGQLAALFDFNGVRSEIQKRLLELVPTRITQTYDFDTRLEDFPSGDPVFKIDRSAQPAALPLAGTANDLVLKTTVQIDLLKNTRQATLKGTVRPFDIRLLGSRLDLATIKFKGAEFAASTGSSPTYSAELLRVEIGSMLEFIKALQSFFAPKPGNGPYFGISLFPPEALAGYRYAAPIIPIGTLFVLNVAIDVSMHLPFDNRQAYFRFAFASRELPFLISAPPYGGGGFVALLANAKGIISFEIQFEFGAVVPIKFGPLSATGRVTAGIYLMSGVGTRVLEGFVCAVGEGNIACFGVSVNIAVRVRQQDGGSMQGSSTYSFSFKVGIAEVSYAFSAQYTIQGGSGGGSRSLRTQSTALASLRAGDKALTARPTGSQWITTRVPAKQSNWKAYRAHIAL